MPKGLSTTAGITIIALAIVVVGGVIAYVYSTTQKNSDVLVIRMDDRVVVEAGQQVTLIGTVDGGTTEDAITITSTVPEGMIAEIDTSTVSLGQPFTVTITGLNVIEASLLITAQQSELTATKTVSVRVFSEQGNTNTPTNTNSQTPTNSSTNTNSPLGTLIDGPLNVTMSYPAQWGEVVVPTLVNYAPVEGDMRYVYLKNLGRLDIPGHVFITGATSNYLPTQAAGTQYWFSGAISPTATTEIIEQQIKEEGIVPLSFETVTRSGVQAVRMFNYRGSYNHYLDITYLFPYKSRDKFDTLMVGRSLEIVADGEASVEAAVEAARVLAEKIESGEADSEVQTRFDQFEEAVSTLRFIQ